MFVVPWRRARTWVSRVLAEVVRYRRSTMDDDDERFLPNSWGVMGGGPCGDLDFKKEFERRGALRFATSTGTSFLLRPFRCSSLFFVDLDLTTVLAPEKDTTLTLRHTTHHQPSAQVGPWPSLRAPFS